VSRRSPTRRSSDLRFGSDLRTNLHLHGLFLDGAYGEDEHGARRFARAAAPSPDEVEVILARIVTKARAWLEEQGGEDALDGDELALAQSHHVSSRSSGAEAHRPDDDLLEQGRVVHLPTRRKARIDGFDLDAEVAVHEHERDRLEYLCRYVLRPPLALDRLKLLSDGLVCIELKHPWRDGTTHVSMSTSTFLARLASLVPRPRANTTLYFGVLAPHSRDRASITPKPTTKTSRVEDSSWAALMKHSFGLDVLSCPKCKGRLRFVAIVFDPDEVKRAGLGAKSDRRRNFELGIWTEDEALLDAVQALFDHLWRGGECAGCARRELCDAPIDELIALTSSRPA